MRWNAVENTSKSSKKLTKETIKVKSEFVQLQVSGPVK